MRFFIFRKLITEKSLQKQKTCEFTEKAIAIDWAGRGGNFCSKYDTITAISYILK